MKIRFIALSIVLMLMLSLTLSPAQAQKPYWIKPGVYATYDYDGYLPAPGTPLTTYYKWTVGAIDDNPYTPGAVFHIEYGAGIATQDIAVLFADGLYDIYLPPKAFSGAMSETIEIQGFGTVPAYRVPQTIQGVVSGYMYYDKQSGIVLWADLGGDGFYFRIRIKECTPGLVNPELIGPTTPTPTPEPKIMGLDPMMFYAIIIIIAVVIIGSIIAIFLRRRPSHYPPPPPPPATAHPPPPPAYQKTTAPLCPRCGQQLEADSRFCNKCGKKI